MAPETQAFDLAALLLAQAVDILGDEGLEVPDRQFVTYGPPVRGFCPQVSVDVAELNFGVSNIANVPTRSGQVAPNILRLGLEVLRCVPTIEAVGGKVQIPAADDLTDAAEVTLKDGLTLLRRLRARAQAEIFGKGRSVAVGPATSITPEAGKGGVRILVTIEL